MFKFKTINSQITCSFSILLTAIIFCIIIAVAGVFSNRFTEQKTEIMRSTLETVSGSIESRVNDLRKLAQGLRRDTFVKESLEEGNLNDETATTLNELYMYGLKSVVLITANKNVINFPFVLEADISAMQAATGFNRFITSKREEIFSFPHAFPFKNKENNPNYNTQLSYFHVLRDRPDMEAYGYVQLNISKDMLFEDRSALIDAQFDYFYIIDGSGNVIYSSESYDKNEMTLKFAVDFSKNKYDSMETKYDEYAYFHYSMPTYPDWHMVGVASIKSITSSARLLNIMVGTFGVVGVLMVIVLSLSISKRITSPIKKMGTAMQIFESGTMPNKLEIKASGEVEQLIHGFNNMIDSIETNIETIYIEQEEKKIAEVTALRYQIQSLQQQISPHFLYNTINVISYLAMENRTDEIRKFVQSLNQLLRATLSNLHDEVMMQQEISFLKAYAHLMEYRYKDMFELELEIDSDTLECMLPKLILQPLVENSLLHGIFPSGRKCTISVRSCCIADRLFVSVADNGIGIPEEKMAELFESKKGFNNIGLTNINDRLKLCYGISSKLGVYSERGKGTIVGFSIPIKHEEDCLE
ncbi:MAG: sensor histidine kinase [Oscillospiraceae bacterium]